MTTAVVSREQWIEARLELLDMEKQLTRARDEVNRQRRALPRVRIESDYVFDTDGGRRSLVQLFDGRSQLVVYHFMFGPEDTDGCPHCSFWADSFDGTAVHLAQRDTTFVLASRAPLEVLQAYKKRMGWDLNWVSTLSSEFSYDLGVSFTSDQQRNGAMYNYARMEHPMPDREGLSVFSIDEGGDVYHTYSTYARGIDALNAAYQLLDLTPNGRDEEAYAMPQEWVRRHDEYG
jgi:predicted dithiol-disulfide oxidoreductase (DUF899 family)